MAGTIQKSGVIPERALNSKVGEVNLHTAVRPLNGIEVGRPLRSNKGARLEKEADNAL